jgi:hypothetical protein
MNKIRWNGDNLDEIVEFVEAARIWVSPDEKDLFVQTSEDPAGGFDVSMHEWIFKRSDGELYACLKD